MMKKAMLGGVVLGILVCLGGTAVQAQDMPVISLFGGYSYESVNANLTGVSCILSTCSTGIHGYNFAATWNLTTHLGLEANLAGHNGSTVPFSEVTPTPGSIDQDTDLYTYTFGPKVTQSLGNFDIYTHFLVGVTHGHASITEVGDFCDGPCVTTAGRGTGFAFQTGGGLDWYHGHWGIRILEVDYVHGNIDATVNTNTSTTVETFPATMNNVRLATGILFRWGMRK